MAQALAWTTYRVPDALLSDTEESLVGTEWHQDAISALADMLREVARRRGASWGVCSQIALLGLQHVSGSPYDPRPDVMVLRRPLPSGRMSSIPLAEVGTPLFIAEVASVSTVRNDVGDKQHAYAAIGVPEYLVFDPDGDLLPAVIQAWRLEGGIYVPWEPQADGTWYSASLEVTIEPAQPFLGVRDRDGAEIALPSVVRAHAQNLERERMEDARRIADLERERADDARRIADLEEQLRRLCEGRDGQGT